MRMKHLLFSLALLFACSLGGAEVKLFDGNVMLRMCEATLKVDKTVTDMMDRNYLLGWVDGYDAAARDHPAYDIPFSVTKEQKVRVIKKWLEDHPKWLDQPAELLIVMIYVESFSTKKE
jgi:hypothetical protein